MAQNCGLDDAARTHRLPPGERVRLVAAIAARPSLWPTALRQWRRHVPRGWWRRPPYLPVPPRRYIAFRLETAYGPDATARASDLIEYLAWCRAERRRGVNR